MHSGAGAFYSAAPRLLIEFFFVVYLSRKYLALRGIRAICLMADALVDLLSRLFLLLERR